MRTILLDVDGVLVTGRPDDGKHLFTDLERDLGIPVPVLQREFFVPHWPAIVTGNKPLLPDLAAVLARIAPAVSAETLLDYWLRHDARIDGELLAAIDRQRAAGTRVFLATNQEHHRARYLMEELALGAHVDGIFYSAALGARKPDRAFFAAVAARLDDPAPVFVDDTPANVQAARRFGWRAIHWLAPMTLEAALDRIAGQVTPG